MKKLFLCTLYLILCTSSFAQDQHKLDSLQLLLKNHNATKLELHIKSPSLYDTTAANILYEIIQCYWSNDSVKAMEYVRQCLSLSEQIGFKPGVGNAYLSMGCININKGNYPQAQEYLQMALNKFNEVGYKKGIAGCYVDMGILYSNQGNYPEALKNSIAGLKIAEEIGDKQGVCYTQILIGNIYQYLGNYPEALKNHLAGLKISEEIGDKQGISASYNNIGEVYKAQSNYTEALSWYLKSMNVTEETGHKQFLAIVISNVADIYMRQNNYAEAIKNYLAALKIAEEIGDKYNIVNTSNNIGKVYEKQGNLKEALKYETKGLELAREIKAQDVMKDAYKELAVIDSAMGNFKGAFENHKLYMQVNDSIFNMEKEKKLTGLQMTYDFDKKQDSTRAEQTKKDAVAQKEVQKQKLVRNGFIGGFAVVLLFAGVFFRQRNKISKEKKISEEERKKSDAEKKRSEELLLNILPGEVAEELKLTGTAKAKSFTMVTVMFTDFKDFTNVSERVSAELLVDEIHTCFSAFDNILQKHRIEKIKTIGDAYLCASGLPVSNYTHATDMIEAAFEIRNFMLQRKKEKEARGEIPFELRIGIHTGPVVAGIVGVKKYAYDIWGDTVNLAARMEQNSEAGKVNISGSTFELVKDKFTCTHRGKIQAKNKGEIDMYFVELPS